ncbi:MAG: hypothetical protein CSA70_08560 [Rhodobacterales bacterium]|nr:MAG: hypothetical protein CSA70_08560 [Rhodobacterales bacterium]
MEPLNFIRTSVMIERSVSIEAPVRLEDNVVLKRVSRIGRYSYMNHGSSLGAHCTLGRFCSVARNVQIGAMDHPTSFLSTHPFQYLDYHFKRVPGYRDAVRVPFDRGDPTVIGNDVWIGTNAVIMRGVTVGDGAIIAANAFVDADVAPYQIVGGLPAKPIRPRFDETTIVRLLAVRWWDLDYSQIATLPFDDIHAALDRLEDIRTAGA